MNMLKSLALAAAMTVTAAAGAMAEALPINKAVVVEYLEFNLVDGANPDAFLRETLAMDAVLEGYDGFVARHLAKNTDGSWVEVVYWTSQEDAEAALPRFVEDPRTKGFLALVNGDSLSVKYSNLFEF